MLAAGTTVTTGFSASGDEAITRTLDVQADITASQLPPEEFDDFYEIERTAAELLAGDHKQVRLAYRQYSHFLCVLKRAADSTPISRRTFA